MAMQSIQSIQELKARLQDHPLCLVYFGRESCPVCDAVRPRVESMLDRFPQVAGLFCSVENQPEIAGQFLVFALPAVLLVHNQREIFRNARVIEFTPLEHMIQAYAIEYDRKMP